MAEAPVTEEREVDALIVGGGPGGMSAAITAAQVWPGHSVLLIRPEEEPVVPCGIPYIFGTLRGVEHDLLSSAPFRTLGGEILCDRVTEVDLDNRSAHTESGVLVHWGRLVLATGTVPHLPPIPGIRRPGVFVIRKDYDHLEHLFEELIPGAKRLAVVGGGFIGVEFADEVRKSGVEVAVIEQLPHILLRNFDEEVSVRIEQELRARGITVHAGVGVTALEGEGEDGPVQSVRLANDERIPAEAVLVAIGDQRNTLLGEALGFTMARGGGIWVDAFQRTREDPHVFAVGDCAFKQDFLLRRSVPSLLASTAAAEGRTAGMNLFGLRNERYNAGTIAIYASQVGDLAFGCAGMTASAARAEGLTVVVGRVVVPDHHPPTMPGTRMMTCLLVFSRSGLLLGGQVLGGPTTAEVLNAIGIAIQARLSVHELVSFQFGSHPRLTAPAHPIALCALDAMHQLSGNGSSTA
ncbi:MAG: FAD-dependent oxidoreductase [Thioalkalivibrio sp.]|nr:MAG: FAD-dependent oxidoreductase [Thioalkalivibrio sp.]